VATRRMKVTFWGVRGTLPVPGETTLKYGGNTSCISVEAGGRLIVLDAGSGISVLGDQLVRRNSHYQASGRRDAMVLFSHTHNDHLIGFPFFTPVLNPQYDVHIYGPDARQAKFRQILEGTIQPPVFPITMELFAANLKIRSLYARRGYILWKENESPRMYRGALARRSPSTLTVEWYKSDTHPTEGIYFYRISYGGKRFIYATDTEGHDKGDVDLSRFSRNADLLVHDTTYTDEDYEPRKGWGHSTPEFAIAVARKAKAKRLALFHYDPIYNDADLQKIEKEARRQFSKCIAARDGLSLYL
jgi:ribonuclease BN (tRNA processing enzyme)